MCISVLAGFNIFGGLTYLRTIAIPRGAFAPKNGTEKFGLAWLCFCGARWLQILLYVLPYCKMFSDIGKYCPLLFNIVQYCQILSSIVQYCSSGYFSAVSSQSYNIFWIFWYCWLSWNIIWYCQALPNIVHYCLILSGIHQYCPVAKSYRTAQSSWNWKRVLILLGIVGYFKKNM